MAKLSASLLRRAAKAAANAKRLNDEIGEAFEERYGCTFSDVDCDPLIDILDYGISDDGELSVAFCDEQMALCGVTPLATPLNDGEGLS